MANTSICQNHFCLAFDQNIKGYLCNISRRASYPPRGYHNIKIGGYGDLLLITKGIAITVKQRADGKQLGIECLEKGDIIGVSNIFLEKKDHAVFYSKTELNVCCFPTDKLENLCLQFPEVSREIIRNLSQRFAKAINNLEHITLDNSTEKILYIIKRLSYDRDILPDHRISFTHEELALLAGMNRVTASRVIDKLRRANLIVSLGRGRYMITNNNHDI